MTQQENKDKDKLEKELLVLFLLLLKYSQDKRVKELYSRYKINRDLLKIEVNKIYVKYMKDNKLSMGIKDIHIEVSKLESIFKKMGTDLYKSEDLLLQYLLYKVFKDSYSKSADIIGKYISSDRIDSNSKIIKDSVNTKIGGLSVFERNKRNKELFVNKIRDNIKKDLIKGVSIEVINSNVDKAFNSGATVSATLINNEVSRLFNAALISVYDNVGVKMVEWVSAMEDNTCNECADLNGEVWNIKDAPIPVVDTHVSCKCILIPVL